MEQMVMLPALGFSREGCPSSPAPKPISILAITKTKTTGLLMPEATRG
jgi:hypothetical protein